MPNDETLNKEGSALQVLKAVQGGECVLFLGAGIHAHPPEDSPFEYSIDNRIPLAAELSKKLAEEYRFSDAFKDEPTSDLQRVSLYVETEESYGRETLVRSIADQLDGQQKKPSPILKMLASMDFKIIVTTNYDSLLEKALRECGKNPVPLVYEPKLDNNKMTEDYPTRMGDPTKERPLLFKIHGDLDKSDSIVITDEDYINFIQRMSESNVKRHPLPATVGYRMQKWPTLFIGYSLQDYNLRLLLRTLFKHLDAVSVKKSFSVDLKPDPLIMRIYGKDLIAFIPKDIWTFVPWLCRHVHNKECFCDKPCADKKTP